MQKIIRLGDSTSHGGKVVSATSHVTVAGIPVARLGDKCTCPKRGHNNCVIVEGDPNWTIDGIPVALEGHKISCGAVLISSAPNTGRKNEGGASTKFSNLGAGSAVAQQHPAMGLLAQAANQKQPDTPPQEYDLFFHLKNAKTGASQPHTPYQIILEDGREFIGISDGNGFTEKVFADSPQTAKLEAPYYDDSRGNSYANVESDTCSC